MRRKTFEQHCSGSKGGGGGYKGSSNWAVANINFVIVATKVAGHPISYKVVRFENSHWRKVILTFDSSLMVLVLVAGHPISYKVVRFENSHWRKVNFVTVPSNLLYIE